MTARATITQLIGIALSLAGALSLFTLASHGSGLHTSPVGGLVATQYDFVVQLALSWADDIAKGIVGTLNGADGESLVVHAYWKHVFILLWLYFGASVLNAARLGIVDGTLFRFAWGTIVSFPTSAIASAVPLEDTTSALTALSFIIGLFAYGIGLAAFLASTEPYKRATGDPVPWGWSFWYRLAPPFRMSFLALFLLALGDWLQTQGLFPRGLHFGLSALVATMLLLGLYWLGYGFNNARAGDVRLGYTVLTAVGLAIAVFALFVVLGSLGV